MGRTRAGGDVGELMEDLCFARFVTKGYCWDLETGNIAKIPQFRLSDNYIRFYLKFIEPHKEMIEGGTMRSLPSGWDSIIGLQLSTFEVRRI